MKRGAVKVAFWVFAAFLCVILGYFAQRKGTEYIREMRQMERVPKVSANHVISGEVSMEGTVHKSNTLLRSRYTH